MDIKIEAKYLFIYANGKEVAYFEHFEEKKNKKTVIKIAVENKQGESFLKKIGHNIFFANVYWFSSKKMSRKIMFVREKKGAFSYLIIIK